ncbi:MAG: ATP-binding cassette domain-containing protein [Micromonosporaceae bacterium]|nr:ATP-binding cassette domain-containing protein [Micromonosporaceae bacterium]
MGDPILVCRDLRKAYGDLVAVDGVSFTIAQGETYGLLGPNGAGKTTTISMVVGILTRDAGEVLVDGEPLTPTRTSVKGRIGYVPQELAVYPDLSGRENLRFFARLYGMSGGQVRQRSDEVLELVGLADRASGQVKTYSGGMKRRLNIAIGLLHQPRLLVLDEPTAGVDPQSRNAILGSVERLTEGGIAVLYTTHYMEEAERLCDRVGIIDSGTIRAEGTRRELISLVGQRDRIGFTVDGDLPVAADAVRALPAVRAADVADSRVEVLVDEARTALPELLDTLTRAGVAVRSVAVDEPNLEAVFLHLTGKALRD